MALLLEDLTDSHLVATHWPVPPTFAQRETIVQTRTRFQAAWWDNTRLGVTVGCGTTCIEIPQLAQATRRRVGFEMSASSSFWSKTEAVLEKVRQLNVAT
ncbi:hypothetical protein [Variovorax sp. dw_308]|uniref:hypothetical protein n=1 Tax=Variovorax sp. dw_308 TaxID=2721546 RepID=UPI001C4564E4|nr:hypothetical protein [Variovorax sp. dw_308]